MRGQTQTARLGQELAEAIFYAPPRVIASTGEPLVLLYVFRARAARLRSNAHLRTSMLAVAPPNHAVCVQELPASGLREKLRFATAGAHRDIDARFGAFDLTSIDGYRRFLEASAAALLPLETALERAGVADIFPDWPRRSRGSAIAEDLDRIGGEAHPSPPIAPLDRNGVFGTMYVLEGSRLGAKYLLRTVADCGEPVVASATNYLKHGSGQPLWRTFLGKLESQMVTPQDEAEIISGARRAFAAFASAAGGA
ncbi:MULTISPECIES: biliverdin-producing heme oxygenase [unclassified Bradyrhizobium]